MIVKHIFHGLLLALIVGCTTTVKARSAVTYSFSGGRFGDNLLAYSRAKYISCLYDIPLLYIPFPYSDFLMMHNLETRWSPEKMNQFKGVVSYRDVNGKIDPNADVLYIIPFFPESVYERNCPRNPYLFDVDWSSVKLKQELQNMIRPICELNLLQIPQDAITVAVHVRMGTGFDLLPGKTYADMTNWQPLKWPPLSFYVEALRKIAAYFPDKKIYAYIFTDHDNPSEIMQGFAKAIDIDRITFDCRMYDNKHDINVLEDFFSLMQFDCLIRPDSHFSVMAGKIADYKMLIAPWHASQQNGEIIIDETVFEQNKDGE